MQYSSAADACRGGDRNSSTFRRTAPRRLHSLAADEVIAALADYFVPPYFPLYPYYNPNWAFWPDFGGFFQKTSALCNFSLNTSPDALCFFGYSYIMYYVK